MELVQPALEEAYKKRDEDKSPKALNEHQTRIYNREQLQRQAAFERRDALDSKCQEGLIKCGSTANQCGREIVFSNYCDDAE